VTRVSSSEGEIAMCVLTEEEQDKRMKKEETKMLGDLQRKNGSMRNSKFAFRLVGR
jgi:hypothetical protein